MKSGLVVTTFPSRLIDSNGGFFTTNLNVSNNPYKNDFCLVKNWSTAENDRLKTGAKPSPNLAFHSRWLPTNELEHNQMDDNIAPDSLPLSSSVDSVILNRKTVKVMATEQPEIIINAGQIAAFDQMVNEAIEVAGWAPFHYDRKLDSIAEPWRFTVLFHQQSRQVAKQFFNWFQDVKPSNKIPKMLTACGALILVNWLPESVGVSNKTVQVNEEHLAAAAAATQNLLLALESRGLGTYWSSGGQLGSKEFFHRMSIDAEEKLIAAIFVNYPGMMNLDSIETAEGKNRLKRSHWTKWTRIID